MASSKWWIPALVFCPCHVVLIAAFLGGTSLGALLTGSGFWALIIGMTTVSIYSTVKAVKAGQGN